MAYTTTTAYPMLNNTYTTITSADISDFMITNKLDELNKKIEQYCKKTDEHVDKLEEDIEFLNDARREVFEIAECARDLAIDANTKIGTLETEHKALVSQVNWINQERLDMLTTIENLQAEIDEMKMYIDELHAVINPEE